MTERHTLAAVALGGGGASKPGEAADKMLAIGLAKLLNRATRPIYSIGDQDAVAVPVALMKELQALLGDVAEASGDQAVQNALRREWTGR